MHFFQEAPSLSWAKWLTRKVLSFGYNEMPPSILETSMEKLRLPLSPTGVSPRPAKPTCAREYSQFLEAYFYSNETPVKLKIPPQVFVIGLTEKRLVGVEIRDSQGKLVGCVFDQYAGLLDGPMGLVTWLCVAPSWRKTGLASCLLFHLYSFSLPRRIHWWRNDGWIRSPIPPIHTISMYTRNKQTIRVQMASHMKKAPCKRASLETWRGSFKPATAAGALVLDDPKFSGFLLEVYESVVSPRTTLAILLQPTFEMKLTSGYGCEILGWAWKGHTPSQYEQAHFLENMLDHLPYDWFEAPFEAPRLEHLWTYSHQTSWSCIGLDPGVPCTRPVYPLCAA